MPLQLTEKPAAGSLPVYVVTKDSFRTVDLGTGARAWAEANGFTGQEGRVLILPDENGRVAGALLGATAEQGGFSGLATGTLARRLPAGNWHFATDMEDGALAALGLMLG